MPSHLMYMAAMSSLPCDLQTLICMAVSIAMAMLDIKTNAIVEPQASLLTAASDAIMGAILVLGLVFYNNAVIDRTQKLANVSENTLPHDMLCFASCAACHLALPLPIHEA
jgi:hypothetical protein